jgi:hypothetical protein
MLLPSKKFNTREASKRLGELGTPFTPKTLEVWRCRGEGPAFIKIRSRVFYTDEALISFSMGTEIVTRDSMS